MPIGGIRAPAHGPGLCHPWDGEHHDVVLQTGTVPEEAGVFVSGGAREAERMGLRSELAEAARGALTQAARALTPEQRLEAHLKHSELVTALHRAGRAKP